MDYFEHYWLGSAFDCETVVEAVKGERRLRVKSFHEKAGSCQAGFAVALVRRGVLYGALPPLPPSFHPHSVERWFARCKLGVLDTAGAAT
jgi:hypothetical protein